MRLPRRIVTTLFTATLAATVGIGVGTPAANAATKPRVFSNCTQLHAVYPHGVGKVGAHDHGKGKTFRAVTTFKRDNALYQANRALDRDKDSVACEKR